MNVRLGETYQFAGRDGKAQSHTNWHGLVFYNEIADVAMTYEQGDNIYVESSLQQRKFTPADGVTRTVHEIHVKACHVITASRFERRSTASPEIVEQLEPVSASNADWPV